MWIIANLIENISLSSIRETSFERQNIRGYKAAMLRRKCLFLRQILIVSRDKMRPNMTNCTGPPTLGKENKIWQKSINSWIQTMLAVSCQINTPPHCVTTMEQKVWRKCWSYSISDTDPIIIFPCHYLSSQQRQLSVNEARSWKTWGS